MQHPRRRQVGPFYLGLMVKCRSLVGILSVAKRNAEREMQVQVPRKVGRFGNDAGGPLHISGYEIVVLAAPLERGSGARGQDRPRQLTSSIVLAVDCSPGADEIAPRSFVLPIGLPLFRERLGAVNIVQALLVLLMSRIDLPHCGFQTRFLQASKVRLL